MIARWFPYTVSASRYDCYPLTAFWLASLTALAWLFLRLESPGWQRLLAQRQRWYPHVGQQAAPSVGDPLRIALQSLWLLVVQPLRRTPPAELAAMGAAPRGSPTRLLACARPAFSRLAAACQRKQSEHGRARTGGKDLEPRQQHWLNYRCGRRRWSWWWCASPSPSATSSN